MSTASSTPSSPRILFLSHYFAPEGNAPATRVHETCRRWVRAGCRVTVVTCTPNVPGGRPYPGYRNRLSQREEIDGIEVIRVWTYLAANRGTVRRILNYLSYMVSATLRCLLLPRPDVVVATSPQFFCGWAGVLVSRLRRRPLVLEIRDLWPESIAAVGAMRGGRLLAVLEALERRLYRAAHRIVTVGFGYQRQLAERGVAAEEVEVIPNGIEPERWPPGLDGTPFRLRHGLGERFVCSYVGTLGLASGLDVVLRAARRLRDRGRGDVVFALVGDGAVREELQQEAARQGLDNVVFTGRLDKQHVPEALAASDCCLVHLRRVALFETVLPSKIFEAAAMERPIVLGVRGDAARVLEEAGAGIAIEPENDAELVAAVERLAGDPELRARLGRSGRRHVLRHYDRDPLSSRYLELVRAVAAGEPSPRERAGPA